MVSAVGLNGGGSLSGRSLSGSRGTAGAAGGPCAGSGRRRSAAAATGCSLGAGAAQVATTAAMAVVLVEVGGARGTAAAIAADRGDGTGEGMGHGMFLSGGWLGGFRKGKCPMPSACGLHTTGESMGALYGFPLVLDSAAQGPSGSRHSRRPQCGAATGRSISRLVGSVASRLQSERPQAAKAAPT